MADDLATFHFPATGQTVRVIDRDGEPWFVAVDVCTGLNIINVGGALARLDQDERDSIRLTDGTPGSPVKGIVSEAGLYSLALRSDKPQAKAFKRWITHDVLPAIRKTGSYGVEPIGDELAALEAAAQRTMQAVAIAKQERSRREVMERELAVAAPKADAWQALASAEGDYSVREAACILNRDPNISTGQQRLFRLLREWKLVDRRDVPYQNHAGHVVLRARSFTDGFGVSRVEDQVRVTVEGLRYLHKRMGGRMPFSELLQDQPALPAGPQQARPGALFELESA